MPVFTERARAKINLSLAVLGRRADGYHEIATVLQAVDLSDRVTLEEAEQRRMIVVADAGDRSRRVALAGAERTVAGAGAMPGFPTRSMTCPRGALCLLAFAAATAASPARSDDGRLRVGRRLRIMSSQ